MKQPILAFALSFLFPGAGLAYLGKRKWAVINLLVVLAIGLLLVLLLPDETFDHYIRYIAMGLGCGSAGLAQTLATQMNHRAANRNKNSD